MDKKNCALDAYNRTTRLKSLLGMLQGNIREMNGQTTQSAFPDKETNKADSVSS